MFYRENGQFRTTYRADAQIFPILQDRAAILLMLAIAYLAVPLFASEYLFRAILIPFLILSLAAIGLNILVGYCGQISLGTGAFMAVGAYAAYNFQIRIDGMPLLASHAARRTVRHGGGRGVRHSIAAHQGPVPRRGNAGRAVLRRLGVPAHQVVHQRLVIGFGERVRPQCVRPADRIAAPEVPVLPGRSCRCSRCLRRTSCAAPSGANGWRSATWTWPQR